MLHNSKLFLASYFLDEHLYFCINVDHDFWLCMTEAVFTKETRLGYDIYLGCQQPFLLYFWPKMYTNYRQHSYLYQECLVLRC